MVKGRGLFETKSPRVRQCANKIGITKTRGAVLTGLREKWPAALLRYLPSLRGGAEVRLNQSDQLLLEERSAGEQTG